MKHGTSWAITCGAAILAGVVAVASIAGSGIGGSAATAEAESAWIVDANDSVCGLSDPRMLSHPARVDHPFLMEATPEIRRLHGEGIDPSSPLGVMLRQLATDRVLRACDVVRQRDGYCSVWKRIRHRDGRVIPDVIDAVRKVL